jgi:type IV conjugative transfer system protein TraL
VDNPAPIIPRYLDEPDRWLIFTRGEFFLFFGIMTVAYTLNKIWGTLMGVVISMMVFNYARKFSFTHGRHILKRWSYWYLPSFVNKSSSFPESHIREYIG